MCNFDAKKARPSPETELPAPPVGARQITKQPVRKYRPANGIEGDIFMDKWCAGCSRDNPDSGNYCSIISASVFHNVDEDGYPIEWQYAADGHPKCTAFSAREDSDQ